MKPYIFNMNLSTPAEARAAARQKQLRTNTAGIAPNYVQANLIILPKQYAEDFRNLCALNPIPCPLLAESFFPGAWDAVKSHIPGVHGNAILPKGSDIRQDLPRYMVYNDGKLIRSHCTDVIVDWLEDHIAFLIGCSYSFESSLTAAGLQPRHISIGSNVPMYRTTKPLLSSGVFKNGSYVVSMRPYRPRDRDLVRATTDPYRYAHGGPIAFGWAAIEELGIADIDKPEWGDPPVAANGKRFGEMLGSDVEEPVFWACGVTPQDAVMKAELQGTAIGHAPGHMLILDCDHAAVKENNPPKL